MKASVECVCPADVAEKYMRTAYMSDFTFSFIDFEGGCQRSREREGAREWAHQDFHGMISASV